MGSAEKLRSIRRRLTGNIIMISIRVDIARVFVIVSCAVACAHISIGGGGGGGGGGRGVAAAIFSPLGNKDKLSRGFYTNNSVENRCLSLWTFKL